MANPSPQGPMVEVTVPISPKMLDGILIKAREQGLPSRVYLRLLVEAAYTARVKPQGDTAMEAAVAAAFDPVQLPAQSVRPVAVHVQADAPLAPATQTAIASAAVAASEALAEKPKEDEPTSTLWPKNWGLGRAEGDLLSAICAAPPTGALAQDIRASVAGRFGQPLSLSNLANLVRRLRVKVTPLGIVIETCSPQGQKLEGYRLTDSARELLEPFWQGRQREAPIMPSIEAVPEQEAVPQPPSEPPPAPAPEAVSAIQLRLIKSYRSLGWQPPQIAAAMHIDVELVRGIVFPGRGK